ncbi:hypothetical protein [Herbiconiux sp. L3-i23]|uniref:DoxX family protein n=1 Tax=Herbiconiux sp. L3-i23 TaxID=2905871 RepID=UPI00204CC65C|nr:hypothetical protein L3i23_28400 [Herbiconiux sp. L3-i23]
MSTARTVGRIVLGATLVFAGISHLTFARKAFTAQVPPWVPASDDTVVLASGVVEIGLGSALIAARRRGELAGIAAAVFFAAIFPGNISQWRRKISAFGLDTDRKRLLRLPFQPLLVLWALWSTGIAGAYRAGLRAGLSPLSRDRCHRPPSAGRGVGGPCRCAMPPLGRC